MTDQQPDPGTYEGEEGTPPAQTPPPPVRYQPDPPAQLPAPLSDASAVAKPGPTTLDRLAAVAGPLSFVLFMVCGFLGGWAWSWLFFLLPGLLYTWNRGTGHQR